MSVFDEKILKLLRQNRGIDFSQLNSLLQNKEQPRLLKSLEKLIKSGRATFTSNKYYSNSRSIQINYKDKNKMWKTIDLINEIRVTDLKKIMKPDQDDPLFCDGYLINEKNKDLFERTNNFHFDFEKYDYYLVANYDN